MKHMKHWLIVMSIVGGATAAPARAAPYWVAWEGNDFPENEGWQRRVNGEGPAVRTLADGLMTVDGLWSTQVDDFYRMERSLDPEPGELFVMQWRVRVNEVIGHPLYLYDPGLSLFSDDDWAVALHLGVDRIRSFHEAIEVPFAPNEFHAFELRSQDMRTYQLTIDGASVHTGHFWKPTFTQSRVDWGDYARGSASSSDWDYFRFGVVPEPDTCLCVFALLSIARDFQRTRRKS